VFKPKLANSLHRLIVCLSNLDQREDASAVSQEAAMIDRTPVPFLLADGMPDPTESFS